MSEIKILKPVNGEEKTEALPDMPCCGNCPFWFQRDDIKKQNGGIATGDCRYNPPTNFPVPIETKLYGVQLGFRSVWPLCEPAQWCGRHPERDAQARMHMVFEAIEMMLEDPVTAPIMSAAGIRGVKTSS
jgi:hypothetical protein